jgi:hypothetical protein
MNHFFDATRDFLDSVKEARLLIEFARSNVISAEAFSVLNKAAIVLLSGKFEAFAESVATEYVFRVSTISTTIDDVPISLRVQHTFKRLDELDNLKRNFDRQEEVANLLADISSLWVGTGRPPALNIDCKFSFGKHGEDAMRKLFRVIGIGDVFDFVPVYGHRETLYEETTGDTIDFRGKFNTLTNLRNNILHEDATPSLTTEQVGEMFFLLSEFAVGLDEKLNNMLNAARGATAA